MSESQSMLDFFMFSASNEKLCAELYHYYSELFSDDPEASRLWKKTALEEENHQRQFEMAQRLSGSLDIKIKKDVNWVCSVNQKLVALLEFVKKQPPDLLTALKKAIEMEEALADLHMKSAVSFEDKSTADLFLFMHKSDNGHIESLKRYLAILELPKTEMAP